MESNELVKIKDMLDKGEAVEAYEYCEKLLSSEWGLEDDELMEKVALQQIRCIVRLIPLAAFFKEIVEDDEGNIIHISNEEYDEIYEMLHGAILSSTGLHTAMSSNGKQEKFDYLCEQIHIIINDEFLRQLDSYIETIIDDDTRLRFSAYRKGYICLKWKVTMSMAEASDIVNLEYHSNSHFKEIDAVIRDKLYQQARNLHSLILSKTDEFPYFTDENVGFLYINAHYALEQSLPNAKDDIETRVARLKDFINLNCDALNSIWVFKGQRVSLICTENTRELYYNEIVETEAEIKKYEPNYTCPPVNRKMFSTLENNTNSGCYVATAVYGSYDCPQVWTLRRYRDDTLAETWYGRAFIKTYYAISPTLVKWFGHTEWFKKMWQGKLDHFVAKLQANGVESTPYEDKEW